MRDSEQYLVFWIASTLVASVCLYVWFLSPLGFGFQAEPSNPTTRKIALAIYTASYFVCLPGLLVGQFVSPILWFCQRTRCAYMAPLLAIGSFLLCAGAFWFVFFEL